MIKDLIKLPVRYTENAKILNADGLLVLEVGTPFMLNPEDLVLAEALCTLINGSTLNSGWISVEDRLPDENQEVLFASNKVHDMDGKLLEPMTSFGAYTRGLFISYVTSDSMKPTHWQALPSLPKTKNK